MKKEKNVTGGIDVFRYGKIVLAFLMTMGVLAGCTGSAAPEEEIHTVLENAIQKESEFEKQQKPLVELENKEKELYEQITTLGMKEYDEIVKLSDEALASLDEREKLMEKERTSIKNSEKEFKKIDDHIEAIEEKQVKQEVQTLKGTMEKRYKNHEVLYTSYQTSLDYDRELYDLFKKEDLKMDELSAQIDKINNAYQAVIKANEEFNASTELYNKQKASFYKTAEIKTE